MKWMKLKSRTVAYPSANATDAPLGRPAALRRAIVPETRSRPARNGRLASYCSAHYRRRFDEDGFPGRLDRQPRSELPSGRLRNFSPNFRPSSPVLAARSGPRDAQAGCRHGVCPIAGRSSRAVKERARPERPASVSGISLRALAELPTGNQERHPGVIGANQQFDATRPADEPREKSRVQERHEKGRTLWLDPTVTA